MYRVQRALAMLAALVMLFTGLNFFDSVAEAAVTDSCSAGTTQSSLQLKPNHGKIFYIDSGQGQTVDAGYASYTITNTAASSKSNLWVQLSNFTGSVVSLANPADSVMPLGTVAGNSGTKTSYFLLKATGSSTNQQAHQVRVFQGKPGLAGSTELFSCTYAFSKVAETIKAAANKVTSMSASTATLVIGDKLIVTVNGQTGTIGSGNATDGKVLWMSPAARSNWPSQSLRLESTSVEFKKDANTSYGSIADKLLISLSDIQALSNNAKNSKSFDYVATYTFRIVGSISNAPRPSPIAQIASGTQMKHTDMGTVDTAATSAFPSGLSVSNTIPLEVTKSVGATSTTSGSNTVFSYTVTLKNTSAAGSADLNIDQVVDTPANGMTYSAATAKYNAVAIPDPALDASGKLVFVGPFTVPANSSKTLTYQMKVATCASGSYSYSNSVLAQVGSVNIGSSASAYQQISASGTCGVNTVSQSTTTVALPYDVVTGPTSAVGTNSATITGSVNSHGVSGTANSFQWGTSPTLATYSTVNLTATTSSTNPVSYSADLAVSSGTVYYYRIVSGSYQGQILSFLTTELAGTPVIATTKVSNLAVTASPLPAGYSASLGGSIDPNQISGGVKVRFQWAVDSSAGACTSLGSTTTVPSGAAAYLSDGTADVLLNGSFATDVVLDVPDSINTNAVFADGVSYCYRIQGFWGNSFATTANGDWVAFTAKVQKPQTITFPTPTITNGSGTATAQSKASDGTSTGLSVTYVSDTPDICTITAAGTITVLKAGTCSLTASQSGNNDWLPATDVTILFDVTPGPPIVTTESLPSGTYGSVYSTTLAAGAGTGTYTAFAVTSGTLPTGLSLNSATGTISGTPTTTTGSPVTLGFKVTDSASTQSVAKSLTISISPAPLTVTAPSPSVTYGDAKPSFTPTYSGFVNGDTSSVVSVAPTCTSSYSSTTPVSSSGIAVTCSGGTAANYSFTSYVAGGITINPATVAVTAPNIMRTYQDPVGTVGSPSYSGWKNSETSSVLTATPVCTTTYTTSSNAGSSPTTSCSGASAANYTFTYNPGTVTVNKASQTISFDSVSSMQPGNTRTITTTTTSGTAATLTYVSGDCSLDPATGIVTANATLSNPIAPCKVSASVVTSTNYLAAGPTEFTVNLQKLDQSITANDVVKTYGDVSFSPAASAYASSGLAVALSSGNSNVIHVGADGKLTIVGAGTATITVTQAGNNNYNAAVAKTFTVTVNPAVIHVTAPSITRTYGDPVGNIGSASLSNDWKYSDDSSVLTATPNCSTTYSATSGAGSSQTTSCSGASATNYTFTYSQGTVTVTRAAVTVTAPHLTRTYGDPIGTIGAPSYSGWKNSDDESLISAPVCSTTYTPTSDAGSAPSVTCSSDTEITNYTLSYLDGYVTVTRAAQEITAGTYSALLPGQSHTLTAHSSSGETPTVTSVTGDCTFDAGTYSVTANNPLSSPVQPCELTFDVAQSTNYTAAPTERVTIRVSNVALQDQTMSASNIVVTYGTDPFAALASASSGLGISYESTDHTVATISGDTITPHKIGTVTVVAVQAGNDRYNPVSKEFTVTINPAEVTVTAPDLERTYGDDPGVVPAPQFAGWKFSDSADSVLTSPVRCETAYTATSDAGTEPTVTCTGDTDVGNYKLKYVVGKVTIKKAAQQISFDPVAQMQPGNTRTVNASSTSGTASTLSYVSGDCSVDPTTGVVTANANLSSPIAPCKVSASVATSTNYLAAGPTELTIDITKMEQHITVADLVKTYGDSDYDGESSASSSLDVSFTSGNSNVVSVTGKRFSIVGAGTATITARQSGNNNYFAAPTKTFTVTVNKAPLTITAGAMTRVYGDAKGSVPQPHFAGWKYSDNSSVLTQPVVCDTEYSPTSTAGSTPSVSCSGAQADNYSISFVDAHVTVDKAPLVVTAPSLSRTYGDDPGAIGTPDVSGLKNGESSSVITDLNCSTNYSALSEAGSSPTVSCSGVASTTNYRVTYVAGSVVVSKASQEIFPGVYNALLPGDSHVLAPSSSSGAVPQVTQVTGDCSFDASTTTVTAHATLSSPPQPCVVTFDLPASTNYRAANTSTVTIQVSEVPLSDQTITVANITKTYGNGSFTSNAAASSGLTVALASSNANVVTVSGHTFTIHGAGTSTITVNQAGDNRFNPAPTKTFVVTINKAPLTITAPDITRTYGDPVGSLGAPSYSGWKYTDGPGALTRQPSCETSYTPTSNAGSVLEVTCSNAEASNYNLTYFDGTVTVNKAEQRFTTRNFTVTYGDAEMAPGASTNSGLALSYSSSDANIARITAGNKIVPGKVGTATITVNQAGSTNYLPASGVTFTVRVMPAVVTVYAKFGTLIAGSPVPSLQPSYSGFKGGDTSSILTTAPSCTTPYTPSARAGSSYAVTCSGASAENYTFTYVPGRFDVAAAPDVVIPPIISPVTPPIVVPVTPPVAAPAPVVIPPQAPVSPTTSAGVPLAEPAKPLQKPKTFTVDVGDGVASVISASSPISAALQTKATRTPDQLQSESVGGFAEGSSVTIQVSGARTTGQLAITNTGAIDSAALAAALTESTTRNATDFAAITKAEAVSSVETSKIVTGPITADAKELFDASGLSNPVTMGSLNPGKNAHWVSVDADVKGYLPGTVVYLTVTTDPIIFGSAVIGEDGTADVSGFLALDVLEPAAHNIRLVGTRNLGGVTVDQNGDLKLSEDASREIQKFDKGTNAVVVMSGPGDNGDHSAVRLVPLLRSVPWWAFWTYLGVCVLSFIIWLFVRRKRFTFIGYVAVVTLSAGLPLIVGWIESGYEIFLPTLLCWTASVVLATLIKLFWGWRRGTSPQRVRSDNPLLGNNAARLA